MVSDAIMAMVILKDPESVSVARMAEFYGQHWPDEEPIEVLPPFPIREGAIFPFIIGKKIGFVMPGQEPVADDDLQMLCEEAWYWPEAEEQLRQQKACVLIGMETSSSVDRLEQVILLTRLTACVAMTSDALGVLWINGPLVHEPQIFFRCAESMSEDHLPVELWIVFHAELGDDNTITFFTRGLASFDLPELEVYDSRRDPQFIYERLFDTAHYLLLNGPVIQDGDTCGSSVDERFPVTIGPSRIEPELKVIQIKM